MNLPVWVREEIQGLPENYTGKIELNCVEGGVGNINLGQSKRPPKEVLTRKLQGASVTT